MQFKLELQQKDAQRSPPEVCCVVGVVSKHWLWVRVCQLAGLGRALERPSGPIAVSDMCRDHFDRQFEGALLFRAFQATLQFDEVEKCLDGSPARVGGQVGAREGPSLSIRDLVVAAVG